MMWVVFKEQLRELERLFISLKDVHMELTDIRLGTRIGIEVSSGPLDEVALMVEQKSLVDQIVGWQDEFTIFFSKVLEMKKEFDLAKTAIEEEFQAIDAENKTRQN